MAAIPITAVYGRLVKTLLVPLDQPADAQHLAIRTGIQVAFSLDDHDIDITATVPQNDGSGYGSGAAVLATTPQPLSEVLDALCVGAVLIVAARPRPKCEPAATPESGTRHDPDKDIPVVLLDAGATSTGMAGFAQMTDPLGQLAKLGLDAPESDALGRIFMSQPVDGIPVTTAAARPLVLSDEAKSAGGERQVAGRPVSDVLEAVLGRAMELMRNDAGLAPQVLAWRPVQSGSSTPAGHSGRVTVLGSPDWHTRPGGVMIVFAGAGAPPGVWSSRLSLYGGLRLGTSLEYIAQAMRRDMGVVLVDAFGYFDEAKTTPGGADRLGIAGNSGEAHQPGADDAASLVADQAGGAGRDAIDSTLARAIGRARRAMRGVMQAMETSPVASGPDGAAAWRRVVILAHAEGCEVALEALAAEGVRAASPLKVAARGAAPGGAPEVEASNVVVDGVGCAEDSDAVAALSQRRVGAIAMLEPSHQAENLAGEVWRQLIERGVAWVAATPGMKLARAGASSGAEAAAVAHTAVVGNIDVEATRTRVGCGVIALRAPRLKAAIDAHKRWVSKQAGVPVEEPASTDAAPADEGEDDPDEIQLLRSVLATAGGGARTVASSAAVKISLRATLWRAMTPHRATGAVWQLVDTIKDADQAQAPALSGRAMRSQWASITTEAVQRKRLERGAPTSSVRASSGASSLSRSDDGAGVGQGAVAPGVDSETDQGEGNGKSRRSSALWAVARGTSLTPSPLKRRSVVGGVESPEALRKAAASLGSSLPVSARVAAGVAAFVEAALGGDVAAALGHRARRKSSSVSSTSGKIDSDAGGSASRGVSAPSTPSDRGSKAKSGIADATRPRRDSASPGDLKAWFKGATAAGKEAAAAEAAGASGSQGARSASTSSGGLQVGQAGAAARAQGAASEAEAEPLVTPLPAPWSQRTTEAAAQLLETLTDEAVWGRRPKAVRSAVEMHQAGSGLPGAMGVAAIDAPPRLVLSVLQDVEARKLIDTRVASTAPVRVNVDPMAGGGRMEVSHTKLKAVSLLISARDVVSLTWWTIDDAGRVLLATASLPMDEAAGLGAGNKGAIVPDADGASLSIPASGRGFTRAFLAIAGWVIEPAASVEEAAALPRLTRANVTGSIDRLRAPYRPQKRRQTAPARACRVTFLMRTNPGGGTPPGMARNFVLDEALAVANMRSVIEKRFGSPSRIPEEQFQPIVTPGEIGSAPKTPPRPRPPAQRQATGVATTDPTGGAITEVDEAAFSDSDDADDDGEDSAGAGDKVAGAHSQAGQILPSDTEETFAANAGGTCQWLPGEEPPTDVTGTWRLCTRESDGLRDFLAAMGVPSAARDAAAAASVSKTTITFEGPSLRIDDETDFGTSTQRLLPDGHSRAAGRDRATLLTAWYAPGPGIGKILAEHRAAQQLEAEAMAAAAEAAAAEAEAEAAARAEAEARPKQGGGWWFGGAGASGAAGKEARGKVPDASAGAGPGPLAGEGDADTATDTAVDDHVPDMVPDAVADSAATALPKDDEAEPIDTEADADLALPAAEDELWQALPEGLQRHRGYGPGAPCLRVRTRLPSGRGLVLEERVLCSRVRMRCVSVLARRGKVKAYMVRYYERVDEAVVATATDSVIDEIDEEADDDGVEEDGEEKEGGDSASAAGAGASAGDLGAAGNGDGDDALEEALLPWIEAAHRREEAATLRAAAAADATSPMALIAAAVMPPCNIAGTWAMDRDASESNEPMLRAWGHGPGKASATAAKATEIGLVISIRQTSATLEYEERAEKGPGSRRRGLKRELVLDGRENLIFSASDRSHMASRAVIAPGDGTDDYTGYGDGAASIVVINYLPQGMGETIEVRRLLAPDRLEQLLLVVRDSREVARIRRVFNKQQTAAEAIVAESEAEELRRMRRIQAAPRDAVLAGRGASNVVGGDDLAGASSNRARVERDRPGAISAAAAAASSAAGAHRSRLSSRATFLFDPQTDSGQQASSASTAVPGPAAASGAGAGTESDGGLEETTPAEVPMMTPPTDLSGVWKVDNERSESLEPLLKAMGVPWMLRGMASRVDVTSTLTMPQDEKGPLGKATSLTILDSSSYGDATQELSLDGIQRDEIGFDGKPMQRTVSLVLPWEDGAVSEDLQPAWLVAAKSRTNFDGMGTGGPIVRTKVILEGGAINVDERRLLEPGLLELRTTFVKGAEQPVTVRRILYRLEDKDPVAAATARILARTKARKAEHKAMLARLRPKRAATEGAGREDGEDAEEDAGPAADSGAALVAAPESFAEQLQVQSPGPALSPDGGVAVVLAGAELNEDEEMSELLALEEDEDGGAGPHWLWREKRLAAAVGRWSCRIVAVSATVQRMACGASGEQHRAVLKVLVAVPQGTVRPASADSVAVAVGTLAPDGEEGLGVDEELNGQAYVPFPTVTAAVVLGPALPAASGPEASATLVCLTMRHVGSRVAKLAVHWRGEHRVAVSHRDAASRTLVVVVPAHLATVDAAEFAVVSSRSAHASQARGSSAEGAAEATGSASASASASEMGAADA